MTAELDAEDVGIAAVGEISVTAGVFITDGADNVLP